MPRDLPDDLSRLGDDLTAAATRRIGARRRRARLAIRLATSAAAAAVALAALAPGALAPSARDGYTLLASGPAACSYPRGEWQTMQNACVVAGAGAGAMILYRPYAVR
jgi:hypothetical protein